MNKAVFLDRDGVINPLAYNPEMCVYEAPKEPANFSVFTYTAKALQLLKAHGFLAIVVSNQPDYAKGKATMNNLLEIAKLLSSYSEENGGLIDEFNYCYHHPKGIVPKYAIECSCRKPGTYFVEQSIEKYSLDRSLCFFVGDRDTDMECGKNAGIKTIRILSKNRQDNNNIEANQLCASTLWEAAQLIVSNKEER